MPMIEIYVLQADLDAATRIAEKMFQDSPETVHAENVLSTAVQMGMFGLRNTWNDTEDQANAKEMADGIR